MTDPIWNDQPGVEEAATAFEPAPREAKPQAVEEARRLTLEAGRRAMDKHAEALAELAR